MTTSAADHEDPTKATITDVATLIASGATSVMVALVGSS